jgi:hypothetical protein
VAEIRVRRTCNVSCSALDPAVDEEDDKDDIERNEGTSKYTEKRTSNKQMCGEEEISEQ